MEENITILAQYLQIILIFKKRMMKKIIGFQEKQIKFKRTFMWSNE